MGVQSHWFSVGAVVPWAMPGVGAVATQSLAEIRYGPRALNRMRAGTTASEVLKELVAEDANVSVRQVAVIDSTGGVAVHTGADCVACAGHITGRQVSCQANMMVSDTVWPAMLGAFERYDGPLAKRLLAALEAAEAEGGDARGRQSAALLVVPAQGETWETVLTLRVEDHPEPLSELRRLLTLHEAYGLAGQADELSADGRHADASRLYRRAAEMAPESSELRFWAGIGAAQEGDLERGVDEVRAVIRIEPGWRLLLERLPYAIAPAASAVLAEIDNPGQGAVR